MHAGSRKSYGRPRILQALRSRAFQVSHEPLRKSLRQGLRSGVQASVRVTTDSNHRLSIAPMCWIGGSRTGESTRLGWATSPALPLPKAGSIWWPLWIWPVAGLGWSTSERIKADLVRLALKSAYWRRKPATGLIVHSDRGSQYASDGYRRLIKDTGWCNR